jgi:hypothetical protein
MQKLLSFLFVAMAALLCSCGQNTTNESNDKNSLIDPAYNPPAEKVAIPEIKGTVYHFNELINVSNCALTHGEDSSGWDIAFINDSEFVKAHFFPTDIMFKKGKYHWENDSLQLDFDSHSVSRIFAKITSTADELMKGQEIKKIAVPVSNKTDQVTASTEKLSLRKCDNGTVYMAWHNLVLTQIMEEDNGVKMNSTADDYKAQMKKDGTWELLFSKK